MVSSQIGFTHVDLGPGVIAGFTNRHGGVSVAPYQSLNLGPNVNDSPEFVSANRALVAQAIGAPVAFSSQVHGNHIIVVGADFGLRPNGNAPENPEPGTPVPVSVGEADALFTNGEAGLGVLVADCVPVILAGFAGGAEATMVATAHAGRRGLELNVVANIVAKLREAGATRIVAAIGPAICGACYEVPDTMREEVTQVAPAAFATTRQGTPALDLPAAVAEQLENLGAEVAYRSPVCTLENEDYFSHRRAVDGRTGRQAGIIRLSKTTTV